MRIVTDKFGVNLTPSELTQLEATKQLVADCNHLVAKPKKRRKSSTAKRFTRIGARPRRVEVKDLTYRNIASMFAQALPVEGQEYADKVEQYLKVVKALPIEQRNALKVAYIFGAKVPREEREDLFQDIALAVLKANTPDIKLAYAIARCDWVDFWKAYKIRQHFSLESVTEDTSGNPVQLGELLVGECEFERKMNGKLDAERIFNLLPLGIQPLIDKRLIGKALTPTERKQMSRYLKAEGYKLLIA